MVISTNSLKGVPMEFNETVVNHGATGSDEVRGSTENKFTIGGRSLSTFPLLPFPIHRTSGTACWASGSSNGR